MKYQPFNEPKPVTQFTGIRVGYGTLGITIAMHKKLKAYGYKRVNLLYDDERKAVKFERNDKKGRHGIKWGNGISTKIHSVIPIGRYLLEEEGKEEMVFIKDPA